MRKRNLLGVVAAAGGLALTVATLRTPKKVWTVDHGKKGFGLVLMEVPLWAELLQDAMEALPCIHPKRDWWFKIGSTRWGSYDDGDPIYTLGGTLVKACDFKSFIADPFRRDVAKLPIDRDTALKVDAEWVAQCDRTFADDEEEDPSGGT